MNEIQKNEVDGYQRMPVGIVIERRDINNKWADFAWHPVAVIPGAPPQNPTAKWRILSKGADWVHYHAATLELELFRGETEGYKVNLANFQPHVYIVLSPGEEENEPEVIPLLATICPYEAESYTEDSDQLVEGVPMPLPIVDWVRDFVEKYHVDVPFKKRKQKKAYDPRKGDFGRGVPVRSNKE